jgi:negative regulator of flagellin synthesis FlgM
MIHLNGVNPAIPAQSAEPVARIAAERTAQAGQAGDVIELSMVAQLAAKIQDLPEVRTEVVARVKEEIAAGTYETPERMEIAVDRLMDELFPS